MLYEAAKQIQTLLSAQLYPVKVKYGPERIKRGHYPSGHVIVLERARDADDTLGPPKGINQNPRRLFDIALACKATIYARSSLGGAHDGDHEREAEKIRDAFLAALAKWYAGARAGTTAGVRFSGGRFKEATDEGPEKWPGAVYELRFAVPRGVFDRAYVGEQNAGAARPSGAATGIGNTTVASAPGVDPATGCDST
jgi:hypothetical protein